MKGMNIENFSFFHQFRQFFQRCLVPYCGGIGLILKDFGLDFHWLMINSHGVNPFRDFNCLAKL